MAPASMDRWTGTLKVPQNPSNGCSYFKVTASLLIHSISKTIAIPSVNAIFFKGDRVEGTGIPLIERLSESKNIAEILVSKLGASINAWVVEASAFNGPFAVYREFVPSVNSRGEPKHYDPDGFPASKSIVTILWNCIDQVKNTMLGNKSDSVGPQFHSPKTALFGFSKGGTVINQIVAELSHLNSTNIANQGSQMLETSNNGIFPTSNACFLHSISEFHYVDAGLNCNGAYLTDKAVIKEVARHLMLGNSSLHFLFHGTPRQWRDRSRPWICNEKNMLRQLLQDVARNCGGRLQVLERLYFADLQPTLQMHFEIIQAMDVGRISEK